MVVGSIPIRGSYSGENWYSSVSHKHTFVGSIPTSATKNQEKMKFLDAIITNQLVDLIDKLNTLKVEKQHIVQIFQNNEGKYVAIFYA